MNSKSTLLAISASLLLAAPALLAQNTNIIYINTNSLPVTQTAKYQEAVANDLASGERSILPPGIKEMMRLTEAQRKEMKPIEDDFAKTRGEYQAANQPRIDAAEEANR